MRTKKVISLKAKPIKKKEEQEDSPKKTKLLTAATRKKKTETEKKKIIKKETPKEPKVFDTNLYTLDMCMECKKKCKIKAITSATMITCPDTTVDIKTWRQEHPRNYAIIYLGN